MNKTKELLKWLILANLGRLVLNIGLILIFSLIWNLFQEPAMVGMLIEGSCWLLGVQVLIWILAALRNEYKDIW